MQKAIVRQQLTSNNKLAQELGITSASISVLNQGKALPSEETMIKLAELAGLPKEEALIDLNLWRSKNNPELNKIWQRLAKMVGCLLTFFVCMNFSANSSYASNLQPKDEHLLVDNIYIMRQIYVWKLGRFCNSPLNSKGYEFCQQKGCRRILFMFMVCMYCLPV